VNDLHGRVSALLDAAGPGTSRPARPPFQPRRPAWPPVPRAEAYESDGTLVVRVPLCEGPLELRVPRTAVKDRRRCSPRHQIEGFNPDATPC
jgi:hypothetical protein